MTISQSQLTKLGERLRAGLLAEDLRLLDDYRRSFADASDRVAEATRASTGIVPMQRSAKSTKAILEKLSRQSTRLGSIQDIAGCRISVATVEAQESAIQALRQRFPDAVLRDRRSKPSHGYRAVHLIASMGQRVVEVQIRTALQHLWAQLSENLADRFGNEVKYGAGPGHARELLEDTSRIIEAIERTEQDFLISDDGAAAGSMPDTELLGPAWPNAKSHLDDIRARLLRQLQTYLTRLEAGDSP